MSCPLLGFPHKTPYPVMCPLARPYTRPRSIASSAAGIVMSHTRQTEENLLPFPCPLPNKSALPRRIAPDTPYPQQARHIATQPDGLEKNALVLSTPLPLPTRHAASGSMAPGSPLHPPPQYFHVP